MFQKLALLAAVMVLTSPAVSGQTNGAPERFTALAVNMGSPGPAGATTVEMVVERWTTDANRERLVNVLLEQGPEKLLDTLQKMPRVGYIRTPNSIGYDLHYAHKNPLPDGGERVVLATDRYITYWEAVNQPRSIDYPFTIIELHVNASGEGEGKMSLATKVIADPKTKTVVLEDYGTQPVLLQSVRRETKSH